MPSYGIDGNDLLTDGPDRINLNTLPGIFSGFAPKKEASDQFSASRDAAWSNFESTPRHVADVDGDGRADIVAFGPYGVEVALGQVDGTFGDAIDATSSFTPDLSDTSVNPANLVWGRFDKYPRQVTDVDGDGRADIIGFGPNIVEVALGQADGTFGPLRGASSQFTARQNPVWGSFERSPRHVADVNGDGLADIIGFGPTVVAVALGQKDEAGYFTFARARGTTRSFTPGQNPVWGSFERSPRYVADVNGDGRADIIGFGPSKIAVALGQADGNFGPARAASSEMTSNAWGGFSRWPRQVADVNGDGRADIVGFGPDGVRVLFGTESGKFTDSVFGIQDFTFTDNLGDWSAFNRAPRQVADVNGDGRADIVGFDISKVYVSLSQDSLDGGEGNDTLIGDGDNDTLLGGLGSDRLYGRAGNDSIEGNNGHDTLVGDDGNDTLLGGLGNDRLYGRAENDSIEGNNGHDTLVGGDGQDVLLGQIGNDRLYGNLGNDTLSGDNGRDTLKGNDGHDILEGGKGSDILRGGTGKDILTGDEDSDNLGGNAGKDTLEGGKGNDVIDGGRGFDIAYYRGKVDGFNITFRDNGTARVVDIDESDGNEGIDILKNISQIFFDVGNSSRNTIPGVAGVSSNPNGSSKSISGGSANTTNFRINVEGKTGFALDFDTRKFAAFVNDITLPEQDIENRRLASNILLDAAGGLLGSVPVIGAALATGPAIAQSAKNYGFDLEQVDAQKQAARDAINNPDYNTSVFGTITETFREMLVIEDFQLGVDNIFLPAVSELSNVGYATRTGIFKGRDGVFIDAQIGSETSNLVFIVNNYTGEKDKFEFGKEITNLLSATGSTRIVNGEEVTDFSGATVGTFNQNPIKVEPLQGKQQDQEGTYAGDHILGKELVDDPEESKSGTFELIGAFGDDLLQGSIFNDKLNGGFNSATPSFSNITYEDDGFDILQGGLGDDTLRGGSGNDTLDGGGLIYANDEEDGIIVTGVLTDDGTDILIGGSGNDTFVFNTLLTGIDIIKDFEPLIDKIQINKVEFGITNTSQLSFDDTNGALLFNSQQFATLGNYANLQSFDINRYIELV